MTANTSRQGPRSHRFLVWVFTILFGMLVYWLLGFVIEDIGTWPGPDYQTLEERLLDEQLQKDADRLQEAIAETERKIEAERERQQNLRDSTDNAQTTMNQLLEFQRLSLQKDVTPSEEEQQALAESQKQFLENQEQYQQLTEKIAGLNEELRQLKDEQRKNQQRLQVAREPIRETYQDQLHRHNLKVAGVKLAVLAPLLIVAVIAFLKKREVYVPLVGALGVAVGVKVMFVMHQYFPARYFKYVLILTFLAIVSATLVKLIRSITFPRPEWLLKQNSEAYERHVCPLCDFPIRRGPLRFLFWTRRTIKKLKVPAGGRENSETAYVCPSCGTRLFEECGSCGHIRHALLPTCEHCGAMKSLQTIVQPDRTSEPG